MKNFISIFNNFTKSEKKKFTFVFVLMILIFLFEFIGIGLFYPIISYIIKEDFGSNLVIFSFLKTLSKKEIIFLSLSFLFLIFLIKNILSVYFNYKKKKLLLLININFTHRLFRSFLYRDYIFYLKKDKSEIIRDASIMPQYSGIIESFLNIIMETTILIFILIFIFFTDIKVGMFIILFTLVIYLFQLKIMRPRLIRYGEETNILSQKTNLNYFGIFSSIKNIILRNNQDFFTKNFINIFEKTEFVKFKSEFLNDLPKYIIEVFIISAICFLFFLLINFNDNYDEVLFKIAFFTALLFRSMPSLSRIIYNLSNIDFKVDLVRRVNQMIINSLSDYKSHQLKKENLKEINFENLEFKNVAFKYLKNEVIKNVNFNIKKNTTIGILGESGSGKSTLLDLISGLLTQSSGDIILNNRDSLSPQNIYSYQNKIAYISQNNFLLSDSIKNNILFGTPETEIRKEQFEYAVEKSKVSDFVRNLNDGYDYQIIDNGKNLSGGQRQRIVMARALYRNANIFLFDEPTSSLDPQTEREIFEDIRKDFHHKNTLVIVTHKESLLGFVDNIFQFDNQIFVKKK